VNIYLDSTQPEITEQYCVGSAVLAVMVSVLGFGVINAGSLFTFTAGFSGACGTRMSLACAVLMIVNKAIMMHQLLVVGLASVGIDFSCCNSTSLLQVFNHNVGVLLVLIDCGGLFSAPNSSCWIHHRIAHRVTIFCP
jgi:hypothetical protein